MPMHKFITLAICSVLTISTLPVLLTVAYAGEASALTSDQHQSTLTKASPVDFNALIERLKDTHAIGFFTKIAIRNDIIDLIGSIKKYRKHAVLRDKIQEIRASFDGLLLKIVALLEDDPDLSRDLYVGRESIWKSLLEVKA